MKILTWNIQGGKNPNALAALIYLKNKFHPDIIFIFESLTNSRNSNTILDALHFDNKLIIDPVNHCWGLWVCRNNNNIILNNLVHTSRYAKLTVTYNPNAKAYCILGIYCPAKEQENDIFWAHLSNELQNIPSPWILLGDFNEMLTCHDCPG